MEVLVAAAEGGGVARVVEEARDLAAQALPVAAAGEHGLSQLRLGRHELLGLLRVRVLQPAVGVGDLGAVVAIDDGLVAADGRVGEADGVPGDGAHGGGGGAGEVGGAAAAGGEREVGGGFQSRGTALWRREQAAEGAEGFK